MCKNDSIFSFRQSYAYDVLSTKFFEMIYLNNGKVYFYLDIIKRKNPFLKNVEELRL